MGSTPPLTPHSTATIAPLQSWQTRHNMLLHRQSTGLVQQQLTKDHSLGRQRDLVGNGSLFAKPNIDRTLSWRSAALIHKPLRARLRDDWRAKAVVWSYCDAAWCGLSRRARAPRAGHRHRPSIISCQINCYADPANSHCFAVTSCSTELTAVSNRPRLPYPRLSGL